LKIGFSKNVHKRIKPYKQICKYGKIELSIPVPFVDIKIVESFIHLLLSKFKIKDEVFKLDVEEAKLIILNIINNIKFLDISNPSVQSNYKFLSNTLIIQLFIKKMRAF